MTKIQKRIKLILIDNHDSFTWNLKQLLDESQMADTTVVSNTDVNIQSIEEYDAIVISPGPGLPKEHQLLPEIITRYAVSKPMLGICLGMQLIVEVFGGQLEQKQSVVHGKKGKLHILINDDPLFSGIEEDTPIGIYHSWKAKEVNFPPSLQVLAEDENGVIMAIKHREVNIRGLQFHPESIITEQGQKMINNWLSLI